MVNVEWKGQMAFEANPPSGNRFVMDAYPEAGGANRGPTPLEALLSSIAACSAMDVISILEKKKQVVTSYRVEVDGERSAPEGAYPRPYTSITVRHIVAGDNLDPAAVERAVQLSDEKYCTVVSTLRAAPEVKSVWEIASPVS
ncbi:MAG: OsmC family protein [Chthonomonas sp.]|nr:OsmC family protein [Chthonomonas sp.]